MSDKECTVFVIDLGADMGDCHHGRQQTDLEWALSYFQDQISRKLLLNKKTDVIGIVTYKCDETKNDLAEQEAYWNINVLYPIQTALFTKLQSAKRRLVPNRTMQGDLISAIVVSFDIIARFCKKNKWRKNMIVLTGARGTIDFSDSSGIAEQMVQHEVHLSLLGVDFDDPGTQTFEHSKDPEKKENESQLKHFVDSCKGTVLTFQEAERILGGPCMHRVRPIAVFKGSLTIGSEGDNENSVSMHVERYPRTRLTKPPTSSAFNASLKQPKEEENQEQFSSSQEKPWESNAVSTVRSYVVRDSQTTEAFEVDRKDLESGYSYGRTIVPISRSDEDILALETKAGYEILGFIPKASLPFYYTISDSNIIIPRGDEGNKQKFSSLVQSLEREHRYALARFVSKEKGAPTLLVLMPFVESKKHYLVDVQLPFAEDVRPYQFPDLEEVSNPDEKHQLDEAINHYVDNMDLDSPECPFQPKFEPENTYSAVPHRLLQAISHYAESPNKQLPSPPEYVVRYTSPPDNMLDKCSKDLDTVSEKLSIIQPLEPKYASQETALDSGAPISEQEIDELLNAGIEEQEDKTLVLHVSEKDPVATFKEILKNPFGLEDALSEMEGVVRRLIAKEDINLALQSLKALRLHSILEDEADRYNKYITQLQTDVSEGVLPKNEDVLSRIISSGLASIQHEELTKPRFPESSE
ncbi:Ku domain-containing protein Pku80 [Schizosaccharomyces cryophilus OY26]|uniref:ATP-dependent DNA helicase II subunit 2 n=1 Tax=Schizosaccharomyces cryophilus (strain OY26 / ATCC MYA-4695 / CBS 11777 / NBRC 106824 / NRRL Y48691) TaxID=653667 RepID=S9X6A9_SCHCR|nr:Ku domain-containing protein Pku80 [Schizosaccharomyces cryophilus OY26]EPY52637.1 Ku domain-containing protein Pku80 [Schizosaccharomyces cryophilus OY26]